MLGAIGYKTKKELKASIGKPLNYEEISMFGPEFKADGENTIVGPDAYHRRIWYATVICEQGKIKKVD